MLLQDGILKHYLKALKSITQLENQEIELSAANFQSSADMRLGMALEKVVKILKGYY